MEAPIISSEQARYQAKMQKCSFFIVAIKG
ncbi:hypothetical protein [Fontibacillus panacisegetis]